MGKLKKVSELLARDHALRDEQAKLNQDITEFITKDLGITGQATLLDISKRLLETTIEPSRIITTS